MSSALLKLIPTKRVVKSSSLPDRDYVIGLIGRARYKITSAIKNKILNDNCITEFWNTEVSYDVYMEILIFLHAQDLLSVHEKYGWVIRCTEHKKCMTCSKYELQNCFCTIETQSDKIQKMLTEMIMHIEIEIYDLYKEENGFHPDYVLSDDELGALDIYSSSYIPPTEDIYD
jgi:hypothetical protein